MKIASSRASFFRFSGQRGFDITKGSIIANCPLGVVRPKVLCPKYVILLPFKSSMEISSLSINRLQKGTDVPSSRAKRGICFSHASKDKADSSPLSKSERGSE